MRQGYGTFNAIDYAIALDVVQDGADSAKDLGLWNLSLSIPLCIAAPIAGLLLDTFNEDESDTKGYTVLFLLAAVYIFVGIVSIMKLKKVK